MTIGSRFPGVEESTSYGTPALKARGKMMCRLRTDPDALVVRVLDVGDREALLRGDPTSTSRRRTTTAIRTCSSGLKAWRWTNSWSWSRTPGASVRQSALSPSSKAPASAFPGPRGVAARARRAARARATPAATSSSGQQRTTAGTISARITVASSRMPAARPVAIILRSVSGPEAIDVNARNRISAALVTSRPGPADPLHDGDVGRARAVVLLAHPGQDEHLVVHRQPEQEGEDHQRASRTGSSRSPGCPRSAPSRSPAATRAPARPRRPRR